MPRRGSSAAEERERERERGWAGAIVSQISFLKWAGGRTNKAGRYQRGKRATAWRQTNVLESKDVPLDRGGERIGAEKGRGVCTRRTHTHTHTHAHMYIYIYTRVQSLYRGDGGEETRTTHTENRATHAGAESSGGAARNLLSLIFVMTLFDWCLSLADGRKITHWNSQSFII